MVAVCEQAHVYAGGAPVAGAVHRGGRTARSWSCRRTPSPSTEAPISVVPSAEVAAWLAALTGSVTVEIETVVVLSIVTVLSPEEPVLPAASRLRGREHVAALGRDRRGQRQRPVPRQLVTARRGGTGGVSAEGHADRLRPSPPALPQAPPTDVMSAFVVYGKATDEPFTFVRVTSGRRLVDQDGAAHARTAVAGRIGLRGTDGVRSLGRDRRRQSQRPAA